MSAVPARYHDQRGFTLVELLVVMVILGVVAAATTSVIIATQRSNQFGDELRTVMDDGRISLDRVRKELRAGRRVLEGSTPWMLRWWTDQNQDGLRQTSETINYCVAPLGSTSCVTSAATGEFQLIRWTDAQTASEARVIARTLTTTEVFGGLEAPVTATRVVTVTFVLDVQDASGPEDLTMDATIRLRNVA
ncbi:MAG: prepilin-type N-terminal cleavage/methylation domain-containing protein [Actinobacteria bacterium]|nr:prepilin-type N-terminal cleavage/methylation domain-containing protein [Actinomycetota bacterium]